MKKESKLRTYRINSNLTQEELANQSGISIRTIQRIEKGETSGSPHTIKALATTLDIEDKALLSLKTNEETQTESDLNKLKLLNFSILSVLLIPFGNIILPSLILILHRSNQVVNQIGRKIISFQIIITAFLFFLSVIIFSSIGRGNGAIPLPVFICYVMMAMVNFFIVIRTAMEINQKKEVLKFFPNLL